MPRELTPAEAARRDALLAQVERTRVNTRATMERLEEMKRAKAAMTASLLEEQGESSQSGQSGSDPEIHFPKSMTKVTTTMTLNGAIVRTSSNLEPGLTSFYFVECEFVSRDDRTVVRPVCSPLKEVMPISDFSPGQLIRGLMPSKNNSEDSSEDKFEEDFEHVWYFFGHEPIDPETVYDGILAAYEPLKKILKRQNPESRRFAASSTGLFKEGLFKGCWNPKQAPARAPRQDPGEDAAELAAALAAMQTPSMACEQVTSGASDAPPQVGAQAPGIPVREQKLPAQVATKDDGGHSENQHATRQQEPQRLHQHACNLQAQVKDLAIGLTRGEPGEASSTDDERRLRLLEEESSRAVAKSCLELAELWKSLEAEFIARGFPKEQLDAISKELEPPKPVRELVEKYLSEEASEDPPSD